MTEFSSSRDDLVASLRAYTSLLSARNEALSRLSATSAEIRQTLAEAESADVSEALLRRDRDIAQYSKLCGVQVANESVVESALAATNAASDELGELAQSVIALREDSRTLAEDVLACQSECEAMLKTRLTATSKALQQSCKRRKLDSAYGPAVKHETPMFMDKQQ